MSWLKTFTWNRGLGRLLLSCFVVGSCGAAFADASQPVKAGGTGSTGSATSATGAGGVVSKPGFGCNSGYSWNPQAPWLGCVAPPANCSAGTVSSGGCTFNLPATSSGLSASVGASNPPYSGSYSATCSNGSWTGASASCTPPPCPSGPANAGACSYALTTLSSGQTETVPTTTAGYSGSLSASCSAGAWTSTGASCNPNPCGATTANWSVGGTSCTGSLGAASSGGSLTAFDTAGKGSATYACTTGNWSLTSSTCAPASPLLASAGNAAGYGYFTTKLSAAGSQTFQLNSSGSWSVVRSGFTTGVITKPGNPTSGTWTTDGSKVYEYTMTSQVLMGAGANVTPSTNVVSWTTLGTITLHAGTPGGGTPEGEGKWTINIRQRGTTSPVLTITVDLDTANGD